MVEVTSRSTQSALFAENEQLRRDNKVILEELFHLRQSFEGMNDLINSVNSANRDFDEIQMLEKIIQIALDSVEASDGSILITDQDTEELVFAMVSGQIRERLLGHRLPPGTGIAGWVARKGEPVLVPNANLDPRFSQSVDRRFHFKTQSLVCVPLRYDNRILGVIQGINKTPGKTFNQADVNILQVVAHLAAWAIYTIEEVISGDQR